MEERIPNILIVDDEVNICEVLKAILTDIGYNVETSGSLAECIEKITRKEYDLVITDLKLPDGDGKEILERVKEFNPDTEVIVITAYGTIESAVEIMKKGAFHYITKPFKSEELKTVVRNAVERKLLKDENKRLRREVVERYSFHNIIGRSKAMQDVFDLIEKLSKVDTPVLIQGESGTGKELVARAIHYNSPRRNKPFVVVNCASIPETLVESELFGHVKGAFTGAYSDKKGLFEVANGGTLFLDEIGELPLNTQAKLLRFLQERTFQPVGSVQEKRVDVRLISATNKDLKKEVMEGRFREDLFFRINIVTIYIPPLRERREDIPLLIKYFIDKYSKEMKKEIKGISDEVMEKLMRYSYPGNVRELENLILAALTLETSDVIRPETLEMIRKTRKEGPLEVDEIPPGFNLDEHIDRVRKTYLETAMKLAKGNQTKAAELLGIKVRSLRYLLDKYGMK